MNDEQILIVGANGQLGKALQVQYPKARAVDSSELDITSAGQLASYNWSGIKIIINAAGYTNVDGAELPEGRVAAWKVNATGVANLASIANQNNLTLVHISTDYVFDGTNTNHSEEEALSPLGVYAQSKAAGDVAVSVVPQHYLLRTSWVIGEGKNFVSTMLALGEKGISPTVVNDQVGRLTFTNELVRIIDHLVATRAPYGTYNATNDGEPASWADITRLIFSGAGHDLPVTGTTTAEYFASKENVSPRPLNSILDLSKLHSTGFTSRDWHDDLTEYINKELS